MLFSLFMDGPRWNNGSCRSHREGSQVEISHHSQCLLLVWSLCALPWFHGQKECITEEQCFLGLEESLFECIIVLVGQCPPCKIMEKPLLKVWNTFLLPTLAQIVVNFTLNCFWEFERLLCFIKNHPHISDFLLISIFVLFQPSYPEMS